MDASRAGTGGGWAVRTSRIEVAVDTGAPMSAFLARPDAEGAYPGVVVGPELFGISAHVRAVCERLAAAGFVALAPDLHHRTEPGIELAEDAAGREQGFALLEQLTREQVLADIGAAVEHLRADGSEAVGMVGLSVGGHIAYLAAADLGLPAVAVLYGGWIPTTEIALSRPEPTLARTAGIRGRLLFLVGEQDHVVPPEHRREIQRALEAAGVHHEIVEYPGVGHGFLNQSRDAFDRAAAADAWRRIDLLLSSGLSRATRKADEAGKDPTIDSAS